MTEVTTVILAPHPDDELIGCFSLLSARKVSHVCFFHELNPVRVGEAQASARLFNFEALFDPSDAVVSALLLKAQQVLLPSIMDSHEHHQAVNRKYRQMVPSGRERFYSIDLDKARTKSPLPSFLSKLHALNALYSSQSALWNNNASYYLFEALEPFDYSIKYAHEVLLATAVPVTVWAPPGVFELTLQKLAYQCTTEEKLATAMIGQGYVSFEIHSKTTRITL